MEALVDTPIEIVYRPGPAAVVPDGLSRLGLDLPSSVGSDPTEVQSVVVEPSFLLRVSEGLASDPCSLVQDVIHCARGTDDAQFRIEQRQGVQVVARQSNQPGVS